MLEAAVRLADEQGSEAITMRRLAQQLGVEAMSLYYHVGSKAQLLTGIVDVVLGQVELPAPGADWRAAIRTIAISTHRILGDHPWAASLMLAPERTLPARLRYMEALLGSLRQGGFSATMAHHAYHALDSYIAGFTLWEANFRFDATQLPSLANAFLNELPAGEYPYLIEHVGVHLQERDPDDPGEFAFGLELILEGLERYLARA